MPIIHQKKIIPVMLFNSWLFLFCFLPVFLLFWQLVPMGIKNGPRTRAAILLLFSLIFYFFWGAAFLVLLLCMIAINYAFGCAIVRSRMFTEENGGETSFFSARNILVFAIIFNLLPLVWFKYSFFIISNLALLFQASWKFTPPDLPLGISFYTFIQIAWLVGVYRQQTKPEDLKRHALFSSCFAWVISGPIVRYDQIGWQLDKLTPLKAENLAPAFALFCLGLAKKVILADSIGFYANTVFNAAEKGWPLGCAEAWLGSFCYTFQLYFDFSGYTDMAIALGLMIGLKLPENFNSPYKSTGIVDFWRRWHITLSSWLRDFLYIPLGGNRKGKTRQYVNLSLTMLIGGAWHGAGWTYIIWGALHGIMLCINHYFRAAVKNTSVERFISLLPVRVFFILFTFLCLNFCWVVFRALSLNGALNIYSAMFSAPLVTANALNSAQFLSSLLPNNYFTGWQPPFLIICSFLICWFCPNTQEIIQANPSHPTPWLRWTPNRVWASCLALLSFICLLLLTRKSTFLYFQF